MALVFIFDGYTDGSTTVKVQADAADGVEVFVCDENSQITLGSAELLGGEASVTVSALSTGQRIIAYLEEVGYYTMGGIEVLESGEYLTGWAKPTEVQFEGQTLTVEEFETATGQQVPDVYLPENVNRVAQTNRAFFASIPDQKIAFVVRIDRNYGTTTVTVESVTGVPNGYVVKFDSDAAGNTHSKTYSLNGTYQVQVIDAETAARYTTRSFTVTSTSPPPSSSEISNTSYLQSVTNVYLIADSDEALEAKIDGVSSFADMVFTGGKRWISGAIVVSTPDTYTARIRVKATTSDEIVLQITIT